MASLKVVIDRSRKRAEFSGPGTYNARDAIKGLGPTRWDGARKIWEVRSFALSHDELRGIFPDIEVVEHETTVTIDAGGNTEPTETVPKGYSVSELNFFIRRTLESTFPAPIFVHGVISSVKQSNGRIFLDLAEKDHPNELIRCAIWDNANVIVSKLAAVGFTLEKDLQVMFSATVGLSARDGRVTLTILDVVPEFTLAKLAALRTITNERLKKEGLFDRNKRLALPFLPVRLGILTSAAGTVINDFRASLDVAQFGFELLWHHVNVQGTAAKDQIISALGTLVANDVDVVLIFRGGGSQGDLSVFNDYDVARAVCLCPKPVLSAIGHQEDQSSVQDVSHQAFGVPKDIGRFFADVVMGYREQVANWIERIRISAENYLQQMILRVDGVTRPLLTGAEAEIKVSEQIISAKCRELLREAEIGLQQASHKVDHLHDVLQASAPETQLKRGFALVRDAKDSAERYITKPEELRDSQQIAIEFYEGSVLATVHKK